MDGPFAVEALVLVLKHVAVPCLLLDLDDQHLPLDVEQFGDEPACVCFDHHQFQYLDLFLRHVDQVEFLQNLGNLILDLLH